MMEVISADLPREQELLSFKKSQDTVNYDVNTPLKMSVMQGPSPVCSWDIPVQTNTGPLEETAAFWMSGAVICVLGWPVKGC